MKVISMTRLHEIQMTTHGEWLGGGDKAIEAASFHKRLQDKLVLNYRLMRRGLRGEEVFSLPRMRIVKRIALPGVSLIVVGYPYYNKTCDS